MYLAVTAIIKNEAPYLQEWLAYHLVQGVERFRLYNNGSDDNLSEALKPFMDVVDVVYLPGACQQIPAYMDATRFMRGKTRWLAYIDIDEFLVPQGLDGIDDYCPTVAKVLEVEFNSVPAVAPHWKMFGPSGFATRPPGLVTENFVYRPDDNFKDNAHVKSIANPDCVVGFAGNPHLSLGLGTCDTLKRPIYSPFPEPITHDVLSINHYFTKSVEEWGQKVERGRADVTFKRKFEDYLNYTDMSVKDESALKFAPQVRAELERRGVK